MNRLARRARPLPIISIIPLVDVLLILLVFFMVTSTFLDLDMLPMAKTQERSASRGQDARTLLLRRVPGGDIVAQGQRIAPWDVPEFFQARAHSDSRILVLPSPGADVQALVQVLDAAATANLTAVSVIQFGEPN